MTVSATRADLESTGQVDQLDKTVGADGRTCPATITRTVTEREVIDADTRHPFPKTASDGLKHKTAPPPHNTGRGAVRITLSASHGQP